MDMFVRPVPVYNQAGNLIDYAEGDLRAALWEQAKQVRDARLLPMQGGGSLENTFKGSLAYHDNSCARDRTWKRYRRTSWRRPADSCRLMAATFAEISAAIAEDRISA